MQVRWRSRINDGRDHWPSTPSLSDSSAVRSDVIPIQERESNAIFVRSKPGTAVAVAGIDGSGATEFMDFRREPCAPRDSLVTIHRHDVRIVSDDDCHSAHRPTAALSRAASRLQTHPTSSLAVLPISHGANSSNAVSSHGSSFGWPDDVWGTNRQIAKIAETQTAEQIAVVFANSRTGRRNAPA